MKLILVWVYERTSHIFLKSAMSGTASQIFAIGQGSAESFQHFGLGQVGVGDQSGISYMETRLNTNKPLLRAMLQSRS